MERSRGGSIRVVGWVLFALTFAWLGSTPVLAQFHNPGAMNCSRCHSLGGGSGASVEAAGPAGAAAAYPLTATNVTELCLSCHDVAGKDATTVWNGATAPKVKGATPGTELPGGDFRHAATRANRGHSPNASGMAVDRLVRAPGGTFPTASETCTSCHDPHGDMARAFPFRLLRRTVNGIQLSNADVASTADDRAALTRPGNSANQNVPPGPANHNVYRGEIGRWCGACHGTPASRDGFHGTNPGDASMGNGMSWTRHPTGTVLPMAYGRNYGPMSDYRYPVVTTQGGATPRSEWGLAASESKVFCLSCHKAHASEFAFALRWDTGIAHPKNEACGKCHGR